jgi:hypothetical protein
MSNSSPTKYLSISYATKYLSILISFVALIVSIVALISVVHVDFSGESREIVLAIEDNTKATNEIIERSAIGIEFTDPPLDRVNSWNDSVINTWYNNPKNSTVACGNLGNTGRVLGATFIVSNKPQGSSIETYITKQDYTENSPGFWQTPKTKDTIPNMIMKSFDFVVCDKTPHQIIIIVRDNTTKEILKYESFTIK